jgi:hypothetical protein
MQWSKHIYSAVTKSNRALNAIKLIRKYFNSMELVQLIISNFYSVLFYNSEIWHLNNLKQKDKSLLLTSSSNALKIATHFKYPFISYKNLHQITKRATPEMYCNYKLSLSLYKTLNHRLPNLEWIHLNFEQMTISRQTKFHENKTNIRTIGMNALCNRFHYLNNKIPLEWLNKSSGDYKIECKKLFLSNN